MRIALPFSLLLFVFAGEASAEPVQACGSSVSAGVLTADLDCSSSPIGVIVEKGGSFDLAGFTLTGGFVNGISCLGACSIVGGGGVLSGAGEHGIQATQAQRKSTVSDLTIRDSGRDGILTADCEIRNVTLVNNARAGIELFGRKLVVSGSTLTGNQYAILSAPRSRVVVEDSEIHDGGTGIVAQGTLSLRNVSISGHTAGGAWVVNRATVQSSEIVDNGGGLAARRIAASDSIVAGNSGSGICDLAPEECVDLAATRRPRLRAVDCGSSRFRERDTFDVSVDQSWGVCSGD